jgi:hypothetical protein
MRWPWQYMLLDYHKTFKVFPPQLWRLATCFMLTGGFGIIFEIYGIYQYGSKCETANPKLSKPGDFFTYLVFICTILLVGRSSLIRTLYFSCLSPFQNLQTQPLYCPPRCLYLVSVPKTRKIAPALQLSRHSQNI